jgi:hypothetical protein
MTSKKALLTLLLIAGALGLYFLGELTNPGTGPKTPTNNETPTLAPDTPDAPTAAESGDSLPSLKPAPLSKPADPPMPGPTTSEPRLTLLPISETTRQLHDPSADPQEDLHIIEGLLEFYRRIYTENPVAGLNEEVVDALRGKNSKHVALIPADHPAINDQGQLIDRWGTPYIFHALSGKHMQIASAGPDKKIGTADDNVIE